MWDRFVSVLLIFAATFFVFGLCLLLAYLGENAFVASKQREALLAEKGIELAFFYSENTNKITIKNKDTGYIEDVTPAYFEYLKSQHGENMYEILEET
jgi:sensor histidine kinase regulating citrate/malate metabolism